MHCRSTRAWLAALALVGSALFVPPATYAHIGAGPLIVSGANSTPTHWDIPIGVPTTAQICGVTTGETGDPLPATIQVWVKTSFFGNTQLTATQMRSSGCYEFTYTPPARANNDDFDACNTSIVAYISIVHNANNDIADDGIDNGSGNATSGFRFVDWNGVPIDCPLGVAPAAWSILMELYR